MFENIKKLPVFSHLDSKNLSAQNFIYVLFDKKDPEFEKYFLHDVKSVNAGEKYILTLNNTTYCLISCLNEKNAHAGFRKGVAKLLSEVNEQKNKSVYVQFFISNLIAPKAIELFCETVCLARYNYTYTYPNSVYTQNPKLILNDFYMHIQDVKKQEFDKIIKTTKQKCENYNFARFLGDVPSNFLVPEKFVEYLKNEVKELKNVSCKILKEAELIKQGFGGICAVGQGSIHKPAMGIFEYKPKKFKKTILIVGKCVTFDTGGYTLKPKSNHNEMKYDMCGAANCFAAFKNSVLNNVNAHIILIVPCVENVIGDKAQRPGNVYTSWNKKTVDVYNTDAEGRLILSDALSFGTKTFKPDICFDMATLTGGTTQIAGTMAGIFCVNESAWEHVEDIRACARANDEPMVHLEILPEAADCLKGNVSDYTNIHNRWADGAATMLAAAFLQNYIEDKNIKWIHFDIANMAWYPKNSGYLSSTSATAFGARTLTQLINSFA